MQTHNEPGSELAQLLAAMEEEYEAALRGLSGLALGSTRHDFITERMERMSKLYEQIEKRVGPSEAIRLSCQAE